MSPIIFIPGPSEINGLSQMAFSLDLAVPSLFFILGSMTNEFFEEEDEAEPPALLVNPKGHPITPVRQDAQGKYISDKKGNTTYLLEPFIPIREEDEDKATTVSDLAVLNNQLAIMDAIIPGIMTLDGMIQISNTMCKLVETRRKVKKLAYGESLVKGGRVIDALPDDL